MLGAVATAVVSLVWCLRIVAGATEYGANYDLYLYYYPALEFSFEALRAGHLPLWNPFQLGGIPGLATLQAGVLYPLHLIYLIVPTALGMGVQAFVHLLLAVVFMALLGRGLELGWLAALTAGLSFALSGAVLSNLFWPPFLESLVWLPLGVTALARFGSRGRRGWLLLLSLAVAMPALSGGHQNVVYIVYTFALFSLLNCSAPAIGQRSLAPLRQLWPIALAIAAGFALAAAQLLPTLELAQQSARSTASLPLYQINPPFNPLDTAKTTAALLDGAVMPPAGPWLPYVGALPLALAVSGLVAAPMRLRWFCALLVLWGGLGMVAPEWFLKLHAQVPGMSWFRLPQRAFLLANFGVALLAGVGAHALVSGATRLRRAAAMLAAGLALGLAAYRYPQLSFLVPAAAVVLVPVAAWARRGTLASAAAAGIVVLVVVDLVGFSMNRQNLPYLNNSWRRIWQHQRVYGDVAERAGLSRVFVVRGEARWSAKVAMLFGFFSPVDYEPLALQRYGALFYAAVGGLGSGGSKWPFPFQGDWPGSLVGPARRFLQLLGVRYFLFHPEKLSGRDAQELTAGLVRVEMPAWVMNPEARGFALFEDPEALPRAYAVNQAQCGMALDEWFRRVAAGSFDLRRSVMLEDGCVPGGRGRSAEREVVIEAYGDTFVRITAEMEEAGYLVLTDSYYPGWQAYVNGRREPIRRANAVARAVRIAPGHSVVEFRYVPWSFYGGSVISGLTLVLGVGWIGWRARRTRDEDR
ncbi:MAG: YfhO family protein [Deltaproteobacteria bacterium]|nr:YfhO family protein [Deltaproteobacteria bacterium]